MLKLFSNFVTNAVFCLVLQEIFTMFSEIVLNILQVSHEMQIAELIVLNIFYTECRIGLACYCVFQAMKNFSWF